jgi:signal transduction histidine kinase
VGTLHVTVVGPFSRRAPRAIALEDDGRLRTRFLTPDGEAQSVAPDGPPGAAAPDRSQGRRAGPEAAGSGAERERAGPGAGREAPGPRLAPPGPGIPMGPAPSSSSTLEAAFLDRVNRALLVSALAAALLAGLLSLLFARHLAHPLRELAAGARRLAAGDLRYRVRARGGDEVGAVAVAFNDMAASLEQAEQARRNLVADVAHELRTPLTVIEGTVEAMLDGVYPADQERLASIREEVVLLNKLVADLRELSLAEAGGLRLDVEPVEPAALVRRAVAAAGARAEARHVDLRADVADGLPLVAADAPRIAQVLAILLDNALRYAPADGTVVVGARADRPAASPGAERADGASVWTRLRHPTEGIDGHGPPADGVRFWVADNGPGIAAADLPHIFDRFYRADPSRARRSGGSGLGLAIARRYVEAHGGRIWAESPSTLPTAHSRPDGADHGRGTSVLFWLPAVAQPAEPATAHRTEPAPPPRQEARPVHALRAARATFRR